jgi:hypothetical protein
MSAMPDHVRIRSDCIDPYRQVLADYAPPLLRGICHHLELRVSGRTASYLAQAIYDRLNDAAHRVDAAADLPGDWQPALALLPYMPAAGWSVAELRELLGYRCATPDKAIRALLGLGLLALYVPHWRVAGMQDFDHALAGYWDNEPSRLVPHPALAQQPLARFFEPPQHAIAEVPSARASDGRELLIRVAVLWQRVAQSPVRLTQQATLFKRDQERLFDDPVLCAPLFDEMAPIAEVGQVALELGIALGLLMRDRDSDSLRACMGNVWQEGLPQVQRRMWSALMAAPSPNGSSNGTADSFGLRHVAARRWATMLLLAALEPGDWITLAELDRQLATRPPRWNSARGGAAESLRIVAAERQSSEAAADELDDQLNWLEAFLQGVMYQLGAVQLATEPASNSAVVRLSALGRWLLASGPTPEPPPPFEKTLLIQPNHEIIVYRQGLTPELLGQLASFCRFKGLGAALELELTADSVYRGLELGRTADEMLGILERHSQRPLPAGVEDSLRTWSQRRERLKLYSGCTVLQFATREELEQALARGVPGERLNDRLLLVADERAVPFNQFRLVGSRDYRHAPTHCVTAAGDGVTWEVELARSDLLVEHELARFAEPVANSPGGERLLYRVTPQSLAAAARLGLGAAYLREWFKQRAGRPLPASVELMLQASSRSRVELARLTVLETPTACVADGILQHPDTRSSILRRLGPTTLAVSPERFDTLKAALERMGLPVTGETAG